MNFTAIDFETATGARNSACAVGIVTVEEGQIVDEYYSLIQPPDNHYWWRNVQVHGIRPEDTEEAPTFFDIYPKVLELLQGRTMVAHFERFDRRVLQATMEWHHLDYQELQLNERWECTCQIYRSKGFRPASLNACCERLSIPLQHHEALSDARACAQLYLRAPNL